MGIFWKKKKDVVHNTFDEDNGPQIELGKLKNGVLELREGITKLDDESLDEYKNLRKIIFPSSLRKLDGGVIHDQHLLEELDFSHVTQLKTIPEEFIEGKTLLQKMIIPQGVTTIEDYFLGDCKAGASIYIPDSVTELGCINGNGDNEFLVYLFAPDVNLSEVEEDVKFFYVPSEYYVSYAKQLKECDSKAFIRDMPEDAKYIY